MLEVGGRKSNGCSRVAQILGEGCLAQQSLNREGETEGKTLICKTSLLSSKRLRPRDLRQVELLLALGPPLVGFQEAARPDFLFLEPAAGEVLSGRAPTNAISTTPGSTLTPSPPTRMEARPGQPAPRLTFCRLQDADFQSFEGLAG